jgi:hypothetical protein
MKLSKVSMIAGFIIAFTLIFELAAHADEANQLTKISFSEEVQVPGKVLPAGNYEFVLVGVTPAEILCKFSTRTAPSSMPPFQRSPSSVRGKPTALQSLLLSAQMANLTLF